MVSQMGGFINVREQAKKKGRGGYQYPHLNQCALLACNQKA